MKQQAENDALTTGLALRAERVRMLQELAGLLWKDIGTTGDSLWVTDVKGAGGELVNVIRFNQSEVSEFRATLDDIAREMGERKAGMIHSGDPTNPVEVVHFYIPDNGRPHPGREAQE